MCILLNINSNILSNPSKQATVAFPGLNYDITRFASIFRVGNGYCGINIEKTRFAPDKKANRSIGFLVNLGAGKHPGPLCFGNK